MIYVLNSLSRAQSFLSSDLVTCQGAIWLTFRNSHLESNISLVSEFWNYSYHFAATVLEIRTYLRSFVGKVSCCVELLKLKIENYY